MFRYSRAHMGVGLNVRGRLGTPVDDALATVERFFRHRYGDDLLSAVTTPDGDLLRITTHPAAETIDVRADGDRVSFSAKTSTVGPGYHADLCETLQALGHALDVDWEPPDEDEGTGDDSGYFTTGDRDALEAAMLDWLRSVAGVLLERRGDEVSGFMLSMPISPRYHGPPGAALLTQTGPRDLAWLERVREDPRAGVDIFPWWEPGRGAAYELGRVLVHLWLDVRFHAAATDDEEQLARDLLRRLARAHRLDPTLDYPWAAWESLHDDVLDADDDELTEIVRRRADESGATPTGYRDWDVDVSVAGGWTLRIPGSFSTQIDDAGTWSAWEDGYTVWATAFTRKPDDDGFSTGADDGEPTTIDGLEGPYRAHVASFVEDGHEYWRVMAQVARPGRLLLVTAVVPSRDELDWAREILATVRG